jgi:uncharacterized protein
MSVRPHDAGRLDVAAFAREAAELGGAWPVAQLPRVLEACHPDAAASPASVRWLARGEARPARGGAVEIWLHLTVDAPLMLICQRCLGPVASAQHVERSLRFVAGEQQAAELDAESEDDVLELTRAFDLKTLVEDELLLALPLVPRHEVCPPDAPACYAADEADTAQEEEEPHPFGVLATLKRDPPTPH